MIERETAVPRRAAPDRRRHLQPAEAGHPARDRRDDPLRRGQLDAAAEGLRARSATARTTRAGARACRRRRSATRGSRRSAPRRNPRGRAALFYVVKPCGERRARLLADRRASSSRTSRPTTASARSSAARTRRRARSERPGDPPAASSAGPSPTAARRRCRTPRCRRSGSTDWRYQLLPVPPEAFAETVRALGASGLRGANVTIPHKEAALALARRARPTRARAIGAANTLTFEPAAPSTPTTPTRPGFLAALPGAAAPGEHGARPRRRRQRPGGRPGARRGRRGGRGLEPHARAGQRADRRPRGRAVADGAPGGPARQLHLGRARTGVQRLRGAARDPPTPYIHTRPWWTSSTAPAAPHFSTRHSAARMRGRRRARDPGPAGRAESGGLDGPAGAGPRDAGGRPPGPAHRTA